MSDNTDGQEPAAGVEAVADTPEAEVNSEAATETQEAGAETPADGDDAAAAPKKKHWAHERIDEITRQKYEALREAAYWRGLAEAKQTPPQQAAETRDQPPSLEQFDYDEQAFQRATADYYSKIAAGVVDERLKARETESQKQAVVESFRQRAAEAAARLPDYELVVGNPALPITQTMSEAIQHMEMGADVAYHLGKNPAEAARIAALPATRQAVELGRIEASLQAPKPTTPRNPPPPPPNTVTGIAAGLSKDPAKMTMAEYAAWRQASQ